MCFLCYQEEVGNMLIPHLMTTYLFPASKLICEQGLGSSSRDISPVCDTAETRGAAYELLTELARYGSDVARGADPEVHPN